MKRRHLTWVSRVSCRSDTGVLSVRDVLVLHDLSTSGDAPCCHMSIGMVFDGKHRQLVDPHVAIERGNAENPVDLYKLPAIEFEVRSEHSPRRGLLSAVVVVFDRFNLVQVIAVRVLGQHD